MTNNDAVEVLKLYLKIADTFYITQISRGVKFTKGRLKFRKDVKQAVTLAIRSLGEEKLCDKCKEKI